jgi:hypothetical protein
LRAVVALLIVVLLFVWLIVSILKGSDEIQARSEWSVLQNLEVRYRKYPTDRAVLLDKQPPYCAAGVVALDGHARVWILLDAKTKPLLKKLPDLNYRLSGDDMSEILRACPVSNDVRIELQSHVAGKM